jgi:hypothetical protein
LRALEDALARHGKPEIFNTDQGSQFTGAAFTSALADRGITIGMDGKGLLARKHVRAEGLTTGFELIKACGILIKTSRLRLRRVRGIAWHL